MELTGTTQEDRELHRFLMMFREYLTPNAKGDSDGESSIVSSDHMD
jgi:hypothetical protein